MVESFDERRDSNKDRIRQEAVAFGAADTCGLVVDALLAVYSELDALSRIDVLLAGETFVAGRSVEREASGRTRASDVATGKSWSGLQRLARRREGILIADWGARVDARARRKPNVFKCRRIRRTHGRGGGGTFCGRRLGAAFARVLVSGFRVGWIVVRLAGILKWCIITSLRKECFAVVGFAHHSPVV